RSLSPHPPRTPPLSPYTTLFRSKLVSEQRSMHRSFLDCWLSSAPSSGGLSLLSYQSQNSLAAHVPNPAPIKPPDDGADDSQQSKDRKSTRLNSSHVKISYAVFCL